MHPLSEEQQHILELALQGTNVIVDAVAGTGKTTLVLGIAAAMKEQKILQVTYNAALRKDVQQRVSEEELPNLQVHTYHSFAVKYYSTNAHTDTGIRHMLRDGKCPRKPIELADIVVLDEAQDMTTLYFELIINMAKDMCSKENPNNLKEEINTTFTPFHAYISYKKQKAKLLVINFSEEVLSIDLDEIMGKCEMIQHHAHPSETKSNVLQQTVVGQVELAPYSISLFEE